MPNIKFNYLYRDGANYKNYNSIILANPQSISLDFLNELILSKLISETWFYVDQWKLPGLHFGTWDNEIDHTFHEFENVEYTDEAANMEFGLKEFIICISETKNNF